MKTLALLFFLCNVLCSFSQKMDSDYFEEGLEFYRAGRFEDASKNFQYIFDHFTGSDYFEDAVYNLGISQMLDKKYSNALQTFQFVLQSNARDDKFVAGEIMSNPFANYKHKSALCIYNIYEKLEIFDSALIYLSYSDTLYPFKASCGNEWNEYSNDLAINYAELYLKLGDKPKAISKLLTAIWEPEMENKEMIDKLRNYLVNDSEAFQEFKMALKSISISENQGKCICELTFRTVKLYIPNYFTSDTNCDKRKIEHAIKQSEFYRMLESL